MNDPRKIKSNPARRFIVGLAPRLIGLAVLIALVTGALVGVTLIQTSRGVLREHILLSNFSAAHLAAEYASNYIKGAETNLLQFAARKLLIRAVREKNLPEAEAHLAQILDISALFDSASIYTAQGIGWASGLKDKWQNRGGSVADREWFQRILATRKPYFGIPVFSRGTGHPAGVYAVPIFDANGGINAVLIGGISLAALSQAIAGLNVSRAARSSLLDARQGGLIIAHPDPKRIMTPVKERNEAELRALAGEQGNLEMKDNGESVLAAFAPVPGLPWSVLILVPTNEVFAPLDSLTLQAVLYVSAIVLISALLGIILARSIVRPVRELVKGTAEIGRGNLDFRIKVKSRDEIGQLSNDFNQMASDLKSVTASRDDLDREIAERMESEKELRLSEEKFSKAFQTSPYAITITRAADGRFIDVNDTFHTMTGFTREEVFATSSIGLKLWVNEEDRQRVVADLRAGLPVVGREYLFRTKTGGVINGLFSAQIIQLTHGPCILSSINDITERKRAEERLREVNEDLKHSNSELEQFAYVASHDLQEPLRMVSSYTQLLAQRFGDVLDQDARDFIGFAVDGANRMQRLIQDLLAYSRITTRGRVPEPVDASAALGEALVNLQAAVAESGALVTNDDLPAVRADYTQLVLLFQNLIGNAIKFRKPDEPPRVHISAVRSPEDPRFWMFRVADNGIGIEQKHFERIFVIFQRLHAREDYPGTGIGLAVCQRIVNRHGGRIWIESEPGKGTSFLFTLYGERKGESK
jgi:PAS domain S-box-containing protein